MDIAGNSSSRLLTDTTSKNWETGAYVAEVAALKPEDTARCDARFQERRGNDLPEDADVGG